MATKRTAIVVIAAGTVNNLEIQEVIQRTAEWRPMDPAMVFLPTESHRILTARTAAEEIAIVRVLKRELTVSQRTVTVKVQGTMVVRTVVQTEQ
jgi:hypothetical protein